jgi:hypothetical protein
MGQEPEVNWRLTKKLVSSPQILLKIDRFLSDISAEWFSGVSTIGQFQSMRAADEPSAQTQSYDSAYPRADRPESGIEPIATWRIHFGWIQGLWRLRFDCTHQIILEGQ